MTISYSSIILTFYRMGDTTSKGTLSGVQNTIQHFNSYFKSEVIRDSFVKWGDSRLAWKLETQPQLDSRDLSFFSKAIELRHDSQDWIMSRYDEPLILMLLTEIQLTLTPLPSPLSPLPLRQIDFASLNIPLTASS